MISNAAVVSAALRGLADQAGRASAGVGFWMLLGGTALVGAGVVWDLTALRRGRGGRGRSDPPSVSEEDPAALE